MAKTPTAPTIIHDGQEWDADVAAFLFGEDLDDGDDDDES